VRQIFSLLVAAGLFAGGMWLFYMTLFVWPDANKRVLLAAVFLTTIGAGWLVNDFVLPLIRGRAT
jgi:hypothetical protein